MNHGSLFYEMIFMPERKERDNKDYNNKLKQIGILFQEMRGNISKESRESFIYDRSDMLFGGKEWISLRYLINIENGKNLPSIEMLIKLSIALETDPIELFENIYKILYDIK